MNLPELIKKHNLKAGDKVNCISRHYSYSEGIKVLVEKGCDLGFREDNSLWAGDSGSFELPKPVNNFVNSQCKNTAENQKALFALGYRWCVAGEEVSYLVNPYIRTFKDGTLGYCLLHNKDLPELYEFTTISTLKPKSEKQIEIERLEAELKEFQERLNQLMSTK